MGGIFSTVLKWQQKNEKLCQWPSDQHVTSPSRKPWTFSKQCLYSMLTSIFHKIYQKQTDALNSLCLQNSDCSGSFIFFGMASLTVFLARNLVWQPLSVEGFKPYSHICLLGLYLWGALTSIFFDRLNSMIYDLKRSIHLRWLFDPVLHSSLDDLVFYRTRVRSLATLVNSWMIHSLLYSRLDWCDPGVWRCQLKTCWCCYCCRCWWWGSC